MASPVDSGDEGETLRDLDEAVCRILADTFHLMCRIRAAKDWPLLGDFAIAFADAIFKYEKADLDKIRAFAAKKNTTLDALLKKKPPVGFGAVQAPDIRKRPTRGQPSVLVGGVEERKAPSDATASL